MEEDDWMRKGEERRVEEEEERRSEEMEMRREEKERRREEGKRRKEKDKRSFSSSLGVRLLFLRLFHLFLAFCP